MKLLKICLKTLLFLFLTALTQIGGIVYLLSLLTYKYIHAKTAKIYLQQVLKISTFLIFYLIATFTIVPLIAEPFGRVRLPLTETGHLRPLNVMTCLLNRNYVRPELKKAVLDIAGQLNTSNPGTGVNYLDANFPFINKFPLLPHLSHNDGKKLDISFSYLDSKTHQQTNNCPSLIGYGICEEPLPGEENTADFCSKKGYWQYSILKRIVPQGAKNNFRFDPKRTSALIELCCKNTSIGKVFIEPHLKTRMGLTSPKIRFHGCQAVRHDDHIHLQLN